MGRASSTKSVQLGLVLCTAAGLAPLAWHINSATAQDGARAQAEIQLLTTITGLRACSSLGMSFVWHASREQYTRSDLPSSRDASAWVFLFVHRDTRIYMYSYPYTYRVRLLDTHTHTHTHTHTFTATCYTHTPGCTDLPPHPMPWCGASDGLIPGRQAMRKGNIAVSTSGAAG